MTDTDAQAGAEAQPRPDDRPSTARSPRNIVLLSDGTGNSAGKNNRTNVWRLYQALDMRHDAGQMAFYDDGVGTSGVRFLRLLGGAFGWGFARNVRDLYAQLCRHYQPGDRIYIFGFSRGAFTARTLAGLILACGIIDPGKSVGGLGLGTDAGLKAGVRLAYRVYRRRYFAPVAWLFRWLRDLFRHDVRRLGGGRGKWAADAFRTQCSHDQDSPISFIGVWDTVDAVGLPVDELSELLDKTIYPHRFPDQNLSPGVAQACHAVAIDDERHTFHPVLWNEEEEEEGSERIKQVWFSGMHSNVGGGYPDDDLAYPSLGWMLDEAADSGLRFKADAVASVAQRQNPLGKMYNARAGLALYYRYKPRHIHSLCNSDDVGIDLPKIHHSAIDRIRDARIGYAPAGLPGEFAVVLPDGGIDPNGAQIAGGYETAAQRTGRDGLLDRAQDHIFWRRVLYFLILFTTLGLALLPHFWPPIRGLVPGEWSKSDLAGKLELALAWLVDRLDPFLPDALGYWLDGWTQTAPWFLGLAVLYLLLTWHRRNIAANTQEIAEAGWWHFKWPGGPTARIRDVGVFERIAWWLRRRGLMASLYSFGVKVVLPLAAAVIVLIVFAVVGYRLIVHTPFAAQGLCAKALGDQRIAAPSQQTVTRIPFATDNVCIDTGVDLLSGRRYEVTVEIGEAWTDASIPAGIAGFERFQARFQWPVPLAFPARRHLSMPWFALIGEIGRDSGEIFPIKRSTFTFRPAASGRLHLYVNDAINSGELDLAAFGLGRDWPTFYANNEGTATIMVRSLP